MSKKLLVSAVTVLFLLSGCTDKAQVDAGEQYVDTKAGGSVVEGGVSDPNVSSLIQRLESLSRSIYFDFDQFDVKSSELDAIRSNSVLFTGTDAAGLSVKIEGNCDEWGTDEYNYALGLKRAKAVKDALIANGVPENRITIVSYGETNPACTSSSKECWSKNRRVDFKLIP
ncbi:MAG: OmpA family protein [Campylobacteraceae bacterium]|jgi:peptidoglycan-associated lipoprotein|nr:OmpA family protein [Campylobacteraceae bacterium]